MTGCLAGVRVLELARFQAGPRGGMLLSDLGAEVIKIEPPGGEETRRHPPMVRGQSVYFAGQEGGEGGRPPYRAKDGWVPWRRSARPSSKPAYRWRR
jgi:hypothetical protein